MRWPVSPDLKGSEREKSLRWNLLETTVSSHIVWGCFEEVIGSNSKRDASDPVLNPKELAWFQSLDMSWCYNWPCSFVGSDAYCWISMNILCSRIQALTVQTTFQRMGMVHRQHLPSGSSEAGASAMTEIIFLWNLLCDHPSNAFCLNHCFLSAEICDFPRRTA